MKFKIVDTENIEEYKKLEEYCIEAMRKHCFSNNNDFEVDHRNADDILTTLLSGLGFKKLVKEYEKVHRWCA